MILWFEEFKFIQRVSYKTQHPKSGFQHRQSIKPLRWEKPSVWAQSSEQWSPPHQQSSRRLNHTTLGGMKATKAKLQSTQNRQIDLSHSHSCFSTGIPPEPPCSFHAPASTNQAAGESVFLHQSFGVTLDQKKNLLLEGGAPGRGKRTRHHPPSFPHPLCQSLGSPAFKTAGLENKLFRDSDYSLHCLAPRAATEKHSDLRVSADKRTK